MNAFIAKGKIASEISLHGSTSGVPKATFLFEVNNSDPIPLKLYTIFMGTNAEKIHELKQGSYILVTGRLAASVKKGGSYGLSLIGSYYEVFQSI
jgi:primosomal replication protein N